MQAPVTPKFGFRIRTRVGLILDKLLIPGRDADDAQRKLRQIYRDCEILECVCYRQGVAAPAANLDVAQQTPAIEDVASQITR